MQGFFLWYNLFMDDILNMEIKKLSAYLKSCILNGKRAIRCMDEFSEDEILEMEVAGWYWLNELNFRYYTDFEFTEEELRHMYDESPKGFLQLTFEEYCEHMKKVTEIENASSGYVELGDYIISYIPVTDVEFRKRFPEGTDEMYMMFNTFVAENEVYMSGQERIDYVSGRTGIDKEKVERYFEGL